MEASDLYLLQNVPSYHLQAVARTRHLQQAQKNSLDVSALNPADIGPLLFDLDACREVISELGELEMLLLSELVACGGRANSRDLALYFTNAQFLNAGKSKLENRVLTDKLAAPGAVSAQQTGSAEAPADLARLKRGQSTASLRPYAESSNNNAPQYPPPHPHGVFEQALHRLLLLGLLFWGKQTNFVGRDYSNGVYDGVLIVPQAVMEATQSVQDQRSGKRPDGALQGETHADGHVVGGNDKVLISEGVLALQRAIYLYWSHVTAARDGLPLVSSKLLSRPALRQLIELLEPALSIEQVRTEADVPRLLFLRLLLMKLGLLYERGGNIHSAPAEAFFALPLLERARRCYALWLESTFWDELNYLPGVILRPGPGPVDAAHHEILRARAMVMERVLQTPSGEWQSFPTFIARAKLYVPYLLFPRQYGARAERYNIGSNPYGWDFRLRHGWLTHREGWHLVEGGFIRAMLTGPLLWLGLVELRTEDKTDAFRVVPHISSIANFSEGDAGLTRLEEVAWGKLVVQPNFEMIALAPVSEALLVTLDRFAERTRLEQIAQYRLTKASVTRAVQMGLRSETILQHLEQAAGGTIPQNVSYSVAEWERQARRIELWPSMTLLEVDEDAFLDELFAHEETRSMLGRRLAPLLAEVKTDQMAHLQELFWQHEYLPALASAPLYNNVLESGRMPAHEAQWKLSPDGLLQPCYAVLNLYLAAELARITELDEASGWRRITSASIESSKYIPLEHIVRFLQQYCQGGVPPSFLIRLKLWGGGYDQQHVIHVEPAPMLRLSAQALRDIQSDEELGALLDAEVLPDSRLVRVPSSKLARVLELLSERGFTVEE
ncbi:MAG TPA: helicase-associated domain-containing protein [Ktedonobacteraceae bacterium]|nr:helicase-associated domain-containing protein [Ktedonobacteraceae bacterium]